MPDFTKAIELEPSRAEACLGRGIAYLGLERYGSAIKDFRLVLQHEPNNTDALTNMGLAYSLADRPAEAKTCFEKALEAELDPKWKIQLAAYIKELPSVTDSEYLGDVSEENHESGLEPERTISSDPAESQEKLLRHPRKPSIGSGLDPKTWSGRWEGTYVGVPN